jgi:queuine tRNA-ribosyltransferase
VFIFRPIQGFYFFNFFYVILIQLALLLQKLYDIIMNHPQNPDHPYYNISTKPEDFTSNRKNKNGKEFFSISHWCNQTMARTGKLVFDRGEIQTPVFMPIGTVGSIKGLSMSEMLSLDATIILGNTYHLWLKPDLEVLKAFGGLHKFNTWNKPILTDSGGFQAFSLSKTRKFTEEGVKFRVPKSGELRFLSPEISMQIQTILGSDIALCLDECLEAEVTYKKAKSAMYRTHRWAERSKAEFEKLRSTDETIYRRLFGIPQGAQFKDLRQESAKAIMAIGFDGYSIGGVANGGEPEAMMYEQVLAQTQILEPYKPKHLLGVGTPIDIVNMVAVGIDMFDCVYPTRNARHGSVFFWANEQKTHYQSVQITSSKYIFDQSSINQNSTIPDLQNYTKGYLCHLFRAKELLAYRLATLNNLEFYLDLMSVIRQKIKDGQFAQYKQNFKRVD